MTEAEIQSWFENTIVNGDLLDSISGIEDVKATIKSWDGDNQIPPFTVDYLMRKKCYLAADAVLNSFACIDLVSANKSVSKTVGEILRPDLVCFNAEENVVVLIELKENAQTARQAMTELLAYEHEIQNHLPFLSSADIYFVIVSPEWSTLLDHSLAALNTWSNRRVLGLLLENSSNKISLKPHLPNTWSYLRANGLPPQSIYTMNMCLYPNGNDNNSEEPPFEINVVREIISRKSEQIRATGFLLAWENTYPKAIAKWIITVGVIHPIQFFMHSQIHGDETRECDLTRFLNNEDFGHIINTPHTLHEVVKEAVTFLTDKWDVRFEDLLDWEAQRENISHTSIPIFGDFFGELYSYALKRFVPTTTMHDWTDYRFAVSLIDELTNYKPLSDGVFRCSDLFRIAANLSIYAICVGNIEINDGKIGQKIWIGKREWSKLELLQIIQEVLILIDDVKNITPFEFDRSKDIKSLFDEFTKWLHDFFLVEICDKIHRVIFVLGTQLGVLFDRFIADSISIEALPDEFQDGTVIGVITDFITLAFEEDSVNYPDAEEIDYHRKMLTLHGLTPARKLSLAQFNNTSSINFPIIKALKNHLLPLIDLIVLPVHVMSNKVGFVNIDWNYLIDGAKKLFNSGDKFPSLVFSSNGTLGIQSGNRLAKLKVLKPVQDPEVAIYFIDEVGGINTSVLKEWSEIQEILENYQNLM